MPSLFEGEGIPTLEGSSNAVQYDVITTMVLPYVNWIILGISLFVIIYCVSTYYKKRAAKRGTE